MKRRTPSRSQYRSCGSVELSLWVRVARPRWTAPTCPNKRPTLVSLRRAHFHLNPALARAPARIGTEITPLEYRIFYRDSLAIIWGSRAISDNSTTAAPVGCRRHCSQFRSVLTDTPIDLANAAWVTPTPPALSLIAATSMTSVRLGMVNYQVQFLGPCGCFGHLRWRSIRRLRVHDEADCLGDWKPLPFLNL